MIDMIRIGQTRNLLRASSSLSEIWTRSAHHHPGQRRQVSRTNRPDKSSHSITSAEVQKFLANRAASTKEGSLPVAFPPPLFYRQLSLCEAVAARIPSFRAPFGMKLLTRSRTKIIEFSL
jgi:hypothetical protein